MRSARFPYLPSKPAITTWGLSSPDESLFSAVNWKKWGRLQEPKVQTALVERGLNYNDFAKGAQIAFEKVVKLVNEMTESPKNNRLTFEDNYPHLVSPYLAKTLDEYIKQTKPKLAIKSIEAVRPIVAFDIGNTSFLKGLVYGWIGTPVSCAIENTYVTQPKEFCVAVEYVVREQAIYPQSSDASVEQQHSKLEEEMAQNPDAANSESDVERRRHIWLLAARYVDREKRVLGPFFIKSIGV